MIDINSSSLSEEKPKPRKSMLACGRRRSKSLGGPNAASDFHLMIPMQQSKEERLKQLFKMSFQHTLLAVCREFRDHPNFDMNIVIDGGSEDYDRIESSLEKDNLLKLCVTEPPEVKQNEDIIIDKYVEGIKVLQKESSEWDSIIKEEEEKLEKSIKVPVVSENVANENFEDLSYDYHEILSNTNNMLEDFEILTEHLSKLADGPCSLLKSNAEYLKHLKTAALKNLKPDLSETPRTVLQNFQHVC